MVKKKEDNMARLELEISDKLMAKLQQSAEVYAVEPSDVAKSIISVELTKRERPSGLDKLATISRQLSETILAALQTMEQQSKQPQQQPVFECGDCHTKFSPPAGWAGESIKCPGCGKEWTRQELEH